jgi:F0F1-type ATP synthase assembly protein I
MKKNTNYYAERVLSIIAAVILLYTLYFKFSGHPSSVALFTELGVEPWGRIGTGILELVAGCLLLFRKVSFHGALLGLGIMAGAVLSHVGIIGIKFQGDYQLFIMACIVLMCCAAVLLIRKEEILAFIDEVKSQQS